jgi:hypothetical protein
LAWTVPAGSSTIKGVPGIRTLRTLALALGWSRKRRPALAWLETSTVSALETGGD